MQHSMLFVLAAPVSVEEPGDEDSKMKDLILGATRALASILSAWNRMRSHKLIRARLLARSETTLPRRRPPRWLARCAHRPVRGVRR